MDDWKVKVRCQVCTFGKHKFRCCKTSHSSLLNVGDVVITYFIMGTDTENAYIVFSLFNVTTCISWLFFRLSRSIISLFFTSSFISESKTVKCAHAPLFSFMSVPEFVVLSDTHTWCHGETQQSFNFSAEILTTPSIRHREPPGRSSAHIRSGATQLQSRLLSLIFNTVWLNSFKSNLFPPANLLYGSSNIQSGALK